MGKPKAPPKQASNESRAVLKMYRISDQKLNLLAQQIRGLKVDKAMAELEFSRKRAAVDVLKLLKSAVANADNNHNLDIDSLIVAEAFASKSRSRNLPSCSATRPQSRKPPRPHNGSEDQPDRISSRRQPHG